MFQLYVDGRMYEYVKKKERRRRIKAKGAQEERSRTVGRSENLGVEGPLRPIYLYLIFKISN